MGPDGECWTAPRTIPELDAQGAGCSWTTTALSARLEPYEPLDLLVPADGERARIVAVPGLVPVSQGRLCPNIFLKAWIPKSAILRP